MQEKQEMRVLSLGREDPLEVGMAWLRGLFSSCGGGLLAAVASLLAEHWL